MLKPIQSHETKTLTSSQTTYLQVPIGGKLHSIAVRFATSAAADVTEAAIRAEISRITLKINGVDIVNNTPAKILDLYEYLSPANVSGNTGVASMVELNVGRLLYTDPAVRDLFGIGTANVNNVQIGITAGTLSTIANAQAFTSREMKNENLGMYMKYLEYSQSFNATGDSTVDTLPRDPDASYLAVLVNPGASGVISHGECRVNNNQLTDKLPASVNTLESSNKRHTTPSGYYIYDFADGNLGTRLPMLGVNDLRFITTFSTAPGAGGYSMNALTLHGLPANLAG